MSEWLPIRYRDFYDIPRAIVVQNHGRTYLMISRFDDELDEYAADYAIYELPADVAVGIDDMSWVDLELRGAIVGVIPTSSVQFDSTRRAELDSGALDGIGL